MNKYKVRTIIGRVLCAIGIIAFLYPIAYNAYHPEITRMQILLKFWWTYIVALGVTVLGAYIEAGLY